MVPLHVQLANSTLRGIIKRLRFPLRPQRTLALCVVGQESPSRWPGVLVEVGSTACMAASSLRPMRRVHLVGLASSDRLNRSRILPFSLN